MIAWAKWNQLPVTSTWPNTRRNADTDAQVRHGAALHVYVIYANTFSCFFFIFMSCIFMSSNFMRWNDVRLFHVLQFYVQHFQRPGSHALRRNKIRRFTVVLAYFIVISSHMCERPNIYCCKNTLLRSVVFISLAGMFTTNDGEDVDRLFQSSGYVVSAHVNSFTATQK